MKSKLIVGLAMVALLAFGSVSFAQDESAPPAADVVELTADAQQSVSDGVVEAPVTPVPAGEVYSTPAVTSDCIGCGSAVTPGFAPMVASPMMTTPGVVSTGMVPTAGCGGCSTCGTGCSTCGTGCNSCGTGCGVVQTAAFVPTSSCNSCGTIGQVTYDQPLYQSVEATATPAMTSSPVVTAAPVPAPVATSTSVMTAPMTTYPAPVTSTCSGCSSPAPMTTYPAPAPAVTNYVAPATMGCSSCGTTAPAMTSYAPATTYSTGCNDCTTTRSGFLRGRILNRR